MSHPDRFATPGGLSRNTVIVGSVVALHVAGLWALQSGLLRKAAEVIVPAELLTEFIAPPAPPKVTPAASATPTAEARPQGGSAPGTHASGHCRPHPGAQRPHGHHHTPATCAAH